ncbi:MAG: helix-turn-helix transcriptional regulator [Alcanivorax sp.]
MKMPLGDNLKRLRKLAGLTQGQLADQAGLKLGHISKLERNEADAKVSTIYKLIAALDCSANDLLEMPTQGGLSRMLERSLRLAEKLPAKDKAALLNLVEKYYLASSITETVRSTGGIPEEVALGISYDLRTEDQDQQEIAQMVHEEEEEVYHSQVAERS